MQLKMGIDKGIPLVRFKEGAQLADFASVEGNHRETYTFHIAKRRRRLFIMVQLTLIFGILELAQGVTLSRKKRQVADCVSGLKYIWIIRST